MFYSETLLSKTGPLAKAWVLANSGKISKTGILTSSVPEAVEVTMQQAAPMALRLSSMVLFGVVQIYNRKARYLLEDCSEAFMKLKMVRHPRPSPT